MLSTAVLTVTNPAVLAAAELLTDGCLTDAHLRAASARFGLPLILPVIVDAAVADAARAAAERADALVSAEAAIRSARNSCRIACEGLAKANRRTLKDSAFIAPVFFPAERIRSSKALPSAS